MRSFALFAALVLVAPAMQAIEPELKWVHTGSSNLYAAPVVADVHGYPGLEVIVVEGETRMMRCLNAAGEMLWEYDGKFKKPLTIAPALSHAEPGDDPVLALASRDGVLCAVSASSGRELWRREVGGIIACGILWTDLDDDTYDEVIAATQDGGIAALTAKGQELWRYTSEADGGEAVLAGGIAAADIDADHFPEIFGLDRQGPFCLDAEGGLRWRAETGRPAACAPIVADADDDGMPELYYVGADGPAVHALDADTGDLKWRFRIPSLGRDAREAPCLAAGDLNQDGTVEILAGDAAGSVYALSAKGELLWRFATAEPALIALTLGDVDADSGIEILVASANRRLYCLDEAGEEEWRYEANSRLLHAPSLADIDLDGNTEIVLGAGDGVLRCLSLEGCSPARLMPWPMARGNTAQTGELPRAEDLEYEEVQNLAQDTQELLADGGFDGDAIPVPEDATPRGWAAESGADAHCSLDPETKVGGPASLKVTAGSEPFALVSGEVAVGPELRTLSASVMVRGEGAVRAAIRWWGRNGVVREDELSPRAANDSGWRTFAGGELYRPLGARWVSMLLVTEAGASTWWDEAQLLGSFERVPRAGVFVNQVGYEIGGPKHFTAWSNFVPMEATFSLTDKGGKTVYSGRFVLGDRITGAFGHDWGFYYWRGDFESLDEPGAFRITVTMDGVKAVSESFDLDKDLLWNKTLIPAYRCFTYHRCGVPVSGYHGACHLDDAIEGESLFGGWHDGADYGKQNTPGYVWDLARAYGITEWRVKDLDTDNNGVCDILEEAMWGAEFLCRAIAADGSAYPAIVSDPSYWGPPERETDNQPGSGDEREAAREDSRDPTIHAAALARLARYVTDSARSRCIDAAKRGLQWALDHDLRGPLQFSAAMDLYLATKEESYAQLAQNLLCEPNSLCVESFIAYESEFETTTSFALAMMLQEKANEILKHAKNPFGVYTEGTATDKANFFGTPADESGPVIGNTARILEAAGIVAKAYRFNPTQPYREFIVDQFNWVLGNNPYGVCLMEGAGKVSVPTYHHRYAAAGVARGAVPGMICNGIACRAPADDRPWFDMSGLDMPSAATNGFTLRNNALYISALANLKRIRLTESRE